MTPQDTLKKRRDELANDVEAVGLVQAFQEGFDAAIAELQPKLDTLLMRYNLDLKAERGRAKGLVEAVMELRMYCLGSDASTKVMIERFDKAFAAYKEQK